MSLVAKPKLFINESNDTFSLGLEINSRDDLIDLGVMLAQAFHAIGRKEPWLIANDGDNSSGKSVPAFGVDLVYSPALYPKGITPHLTANEYLSGERTLNDGSLGDILTSGEQSANVVLINFYYEKIDGQKAFDRRLREVCEAYEGFEVIFLQNLLRVNNGTIDYRTEGMQSDRLDIAIHTRIKQGEPGSFMRGINLTFRDKTLLPYIVNYMTRPQQHVEYDAGSEAHRPRAKVSAQPLNVG